MDRALEVITVQATLPGQTATPFPAVAGNSLTVRDSARAQLISIWGNRRQDGFFRLTSPLLHDAVVGIQARFNKNNFADDFEHTSLIRLACPQELTPQDTLVSQGTGEAVEAGSIETNSYLVMYENLAGICGKLITWKELKERAIELYDSQNDITLGTAGGYSGSELLNADQDQLKANQDYAIIGHSMNFNSNVATIRWTSPDWGNLGVGAPGLALNPRATSSFFSQLSMEMDLPTIPVFNASQKSSVFIDAAANDDGGTLNVITHMVRLKTPGVGKRK